MNVYLLEFLVYMHIPDKRSRILINDEGAFLSMVYGVFQLQLVSINLSQSRSEMA